MTKKAKIRTVTGAALLIGLLAAVAGCNEENASSSAGKLVAADDSVAQSDVSTKKTSPANGSVAQSDVPTNSSTDRENLASGANQAGVSQPPVTQSGDTTRVVSSEGADNERYAEEHNETSPPANGDLTAEEYEHLSQLMAETHNIGMDIADNITPCTKYVDPGCY